MQMVQIVGGYLLGGVDLLCCVMGKKVLVEMVKYCEIFCEGVVKDGVGEVKVDVIFDLMEKFVGYGFNKLYVVVYVLVSYQIVWLKWYYFVEFMVVMLFLDMDNIDKVVGFFVEVCNFGLIVQLLCVNELVYMFEVFSVDIIVYGLGVIKGVGQGVCEVIVEECWCGGCYVFLLDFCMCIELGKFNWCIFEVMINCGVFDGFGKNCVLFMLQLLEVFKVIDQMLCEKVFGQNLLFGVFDLVSIVQQLDLFEVKEWVLG